MARLARLNVVNVPHHVTQRGNARQFLLATDDQRIVYLNLDRFPTNGSSFATGRATTNNSLSSRPYLAPAFLSAAFASAAIDAEGSLLTLTSQANLLYTSDCTSTINSLVQLSATYDLARIRPDGSYTLTPYYTRTNTNILPARPAPPLSPYLCAEVFDSQRNFVGCGVFVFGSNHLILQSLAPTVQPFRPIPDGQGGALIPVRIQDPNTPGAALAHVFHVPSSGNVVDIVVPLPAPGVQQTILNTGTRAFDLVLGENNVAFATDGFSLASFDFTTGQTLWTYQSSSISKAIRLIASASGNSLATKISDISNTASFGQENVLRFDSSGNATPDNWTGSLIDHWFGGMWPATPTATGATSMFSGSSTVVALSSWPMGDGNRQKQHSSPKLEIDTFMPIAPAAGTANPRFNSARAAKADLDTNIPKKIAADRVFTDSTDVSDLASIPAFDAQSAKPLDALAFIGHGVYSVGVPNFAYGMQFVDNQLVRNGFQVNFAQTARDILRTSAKIIFVAACDTGVVFTTWWDMTSNAPPGGRVLIVPDLSAMAQLPVNNGISLTHSQDVDLVQGTVAWETLINSLHSGKTAQQAVADANNAVAQLYPLLIYPAGQTLPQVVFKPIGNSTLCLQNCANPKN